MKDKVLIVSYVYPPSTGVGGRRWSKFVKHLNKSGSDIYLLTVNPESPYSKHPSERAFIKEVSYLNNIYPKVIGSIPESIIEKIKYKFALAFVRLLSKGNYYDRSVFLKKQFLNRSGTLIKKHNIDKVIVTAAPFRLLYFGVLLKQLFNIKLVADVRDPWTWGDGYGMKLLSNKRKEKELFFEREVLENADAVTVPVSPMLKHLQKSYPAQESKIKLLPHAYDLDDFDSEDIIQNNTDEFNLIYGGTIYRGLENEYEALYELCKLHSGVDFKIQIHANKFQYLSIKKKDEIKKNLIISPYISPNDLMAKIKGADAYLLIFPDEVKDFITTKFYEIIQCRTPIIFIGATGEVSQFITLNNLGVHIEPKNIKSQLLEIISKKSEINYNVDFPVEQYSFNTVTKTLIEYLK